MNEVYIVQDESDVIRTVTADVCRAVDILADCPEWWMMAVEVDGRDKPLWSFGWQDPRVVRPGGWKVYRMRRQHEDVPGTFFRD